MSKKLQTRGFSAPTLLLVLFIVAAVSLGGWYVWHRNQQSEGVRKPGSNSQVDSKKTSSDGSTPANTYEGWKSHTNTEYGISFRYPADWAAEEGAFSSLNSATKQEYEIDLKRNQEIKYNGTITIEILGEDLETATAWYDNSQSSSSKITKTTVPLKGKKSVQYTVTNSGVVKRYLFSVDSKTYVFSSINEQLNVQTDADYWVKFGKVFDSLQINL